MASFPLIVEARLSPSNLSSSLRTGPDGGACHGHMDGGSALPSQQVGRAASSLRYSQGLCRWTLKRVRPGPKRWPWSGRKRSRPKPLDIRCPIQGLLRLYSRYGLSDCSIARGDLCHEASARWVAPPNRSSATSATDNSLGGTFLHWQTAPSGRTEFSRLAPSEPQKRVDPDTPALLTYASAWCGPIVPLRPKSKSLALPGSKVRSRSPGTSPPRACRPEAPRDEPARLRVRPRRG
jgi:hypothetical protein